MPKMFTFICTIQFFLDTVFIAGHMHLSNDFSEPNLSCVVIVILFGEVHAEITNGFLCNTFIFFKIVAISTTLDCPYSIHRPTSSKHQNLWRSKTAEFQKQTRYYSYH